MREALGVLELVIKRDAVFEFQAFNTGAGKSGNGDQHRQNCSRYSNEPHLRE